MLCSMCRNFYENESRVSNRDTFKIIQNNLISTLQHSGDMGIELLKAEIALELNIKYVQDKDLIF